MAEALPGKLGQPGNTGAHGRFETLVLAGRRGPEDPLSKQSGLSHRALLPVAGVLPGLQPDYLMKQ